jgi:hypothetical protein
MGEHGAVRSATGADWGDIVDFAEAAARLRSERELQIEAKVLQESCGPNPYSDFLLKNGQRPSRKEAKTIGRLMGVRVRASDGTLQPQPTKVESSVARRARDCQQTEDDYVDQILRLRSALAKLSQNRGDPAVVIRYMDPLFGDDSVIREQIAHAVRWINRFAEELGCEQEPRGGPQSI